MTTPGAEHRHPIRQRFEHRGDGDEGYAEDDPGHDIVDQWTPR